MPKTKEQKRREAGQRQAEYDLQWFTTTIRTTSQLEARLSQLPAERQVELAGLIAAARANAEECEEVARRAGEARWRG